MINKDIPPDWKPRHGYFLTVDKAPDGKGGLLAILTDGTPQKGHDPVTVLSLERVKSIREARRWFDKVMIEKPWVTRS